MALTVAQQLVSLTSSGLKFISGTIVGGAAYAYQVLLLGANGKIDPTVLPDGIGPDTLTGTAAGALSANALVNISATGTIQAADCTASRPAHGYTPAATSSNATATVYKYGTIIITGGTLTPGQPVYLGASGAFTQTPMITAGSGIWQQIGVASSATTIEFNPLEAITL